MTSKIMVCMLKFHISCTEKWIMANIDQCLVSVWPQGVIIVTRERRDV